MPATLDKTVPERVLRHVWTRIMRGHPSSCWRTTWSRASHGYPQIGFQERGKRDVVLAHRVVWESVHGPIPAGRDLTVDHKCHNRECLNPAHLRLLPNRENAADNPQAKRGKGVSPFKNRRP